MKKDLLTIAAGNADTMAYWDGQDAAYDAMCGQIEAILGGSEVDGMTQVRWQRIRGRVHFLVQFHRGFNIPPLPV